MGLGSKMETRDNALIGLCRLYDGGETNPYNPDSVKPSEWANEYLKFHIWDAEWAFVSNFNEWRDIWQRNSNSPELNQADVAEEVYKLAIRSKLGKMRVDDKYDFHKMYFEL